MEEGEQLEGVHRPQPGDVDLINPPDDLHFLMAHRCLSEDVEAAPLRGMHICLVCFFIVLLQAASAVVVMNSMGNRFG